MPLQKDIIVIDANVILRYLLKDNEEFYKKAEWIFNKAFSGKKKVLIIHSVVVEVVYVLLKFYKVNREEITKILTELVKIKGIRVQDKETLLNALELFENKKLDFVDCLLCAYSKKYQIMSFDKDVKRCVENIIET